MRSTDGVHDGDGAPARTAMQAHRQPWMRSWSRWIARVLALGAALVIIASCGGGDDTDTPAKTQTQTAPPAAATPTSAPLAPTATDAPPAPAPATPTAVPPTATAAPAATSTVPPPTATATPVILQEFTFSAQLAAVPQGSDYIQLERGIWRAFGGTEENVEVNGSTLIYQDSGVETCVQPSTSTVIAITRAGGATETMSHDLAAPSLIQAGDGYLIPSTTSLNCKNAGQADSTSLGLAIYRGGQPELSETLPGGLTYEFLTGGPALDLPPVAVILTLQRVILPAGESLPAMTGLHALVFIENGGLNLRPASGGEVVTRALNASTSELPAGGETDLQAGDGVMLPLTSTAELRNVSPFPTTVLIATIQPVP